MPTRERLDQLLYRSHCARPLNADELRALLEQARRRNEHESITGLLLLDRDRFVQWIEGPADAVARVWASIRTDPRHEMVERLYAPRLDERVFPDWSMQFGQPAEGARGDVPALTLPRTVLHDLRSRRIDAHEIVRGLALWHVLPPAADIAHLLARGSEDEVDALCDRVLAMHPTIQALACHLFGPAARALGDAWQDDLLDATDLLVAQGRLRVLMHRVSLRGPGEAVPEPHGRALVAPLPGSDALAGAAFACIALDAAGFAVRYEIPAEGASLAAALAADPVDVLHLELGESLSRHQDLQGLAELIESLRRASAQPRMQVLVGGRAFVEQPGLATLVGADGDGLGEGTSPQDLQAMLAYARTRADSPVMSAAQATLVEVCAQLRRQGHRPPAPPSDGVRPP